MVGGFWGRKIGMTQLFSGNKVVPATVIDISSWYVTDIKTQERDGYHAVQVGKVKKRYGTEEFSLAWLKDKKVYFSFVREIPLQKPAEGLEIGKQADFYTLFNEGDAVDVSGITKGNGFAGVVRRYNYKGGRGSHGCTQGRTPGAIGGLTRSGKVIKGKGLPGHMGVKKRTMQGLEVVKVLKDDNAIVIKGSIPGKAGSLVFVRRGRA
jgi:large subunit ribosomal protein L3